MVGVVDALRARIQANDAQNAVGSQNARGGTNKDEEDNVVELKIRRGASSEAKDMQWTLADSIGKSPGEKGGSKTLLLRFQELLNELRVALSVENIFAKEYFDERGVWRYPVSSSSGRSLDTRNAEGIDKDRAEDITFKDVVAAHPLLEKWDARVKKELHSIRAFPTSDKD